MNISLTPELEQFVEKTVQTGKFFSASEVICEALLLLEERERLRQIRIENLRKQVAIGIEQADRGEVFDGKKVIRELYDRIQQISGVVKTR